MTDRIDYLVVGLAGNVRVDDVDEIVTALRMVKGVLTVEPHVAEWGASLERMRVITEVRAKLYDAFRGVLDEVEGKQA